MTVLRREGRSLRSRVEKAFADLRKARPRLLGVVLISPTSTSFTSLCCCPFFDCQRGPEKSD